MRNFRQTIQGNYRPVKVQYEYKDVHFLKFDKLQLTYCTILAVTCSNVSAACFSKLVVIFNDKFGEILQQSFLKIIY